MVNLILKIFVSFVEYNHFHDNGENKTKVKQIIILLFY